MAIWVEWREGSLSEAESVEGRGEAMDGDGRGDGKWGAGSVSPLKRGGLVWWLEV